MLMAQPAKPAPSPITAERVLANFEKALKTPDAKEFKNVHFSVSVYPEMFTHFLGTIDQTTLADGRFYEDSYDLSNANTRTGFDGSEVWYTGIPMFLGGSMDIEGKVRSSIKQPEDALLLAWRSEFFPGAPNWRKDFKEFKLLGAAPVEGKTAIVLRGTLKSGDAVNFYFDPVSNLMVKTEYPVHFKDHSGQKRALLQVRYYADYAKRDGWMLPRKVHVESSGGSALFVVQKVEFDIPFDEKKIQKPRM